MEIRVKSQCSVIILLITEYAYRSAPANNSKLTLPPDSSRFL